MGDIKIWDKVRLTLGGIEAQVTSLIGDDSFICKWHVDGVLHMATLARSELTLLDMTELHAFREYC